MLEFARRLAARRRPIWLRYVLLPGLTDDPRADVRALQERGAEGVLSDTSSSGDCAGPEMTFPSAVKREP